MHLAAHKPDLYACPTEDGAIVLNLATERYYTLSRNTVHQSMDNTFFRAHGIALHGGSIDTEKLSAVQAVRGSFPATAQYLLALLFATAHVTFVRGLFGTRAVICRLSRLKRRRNISQHAAEASCALPYATHAFRRFRPFLYTARDHCLFDAMVLAVYLLRLGHDATFVIAVRTQPFQAHAWTQSGNDLVDDFPEKAQLFSPILVV